MALRKSRREPEVPQTNNYVQKWVTGGTLTDSIIRDDGSSVGVGMSPNSKLSILDSTNQSSFQNNTPGSLNVETGDGSNSIYTTLTLSDNSHQKLGKIGALKTASGSYLYFGTSNNYSSGITNSAL